MRGPAIFTARANLYSGGTMYAAVSGIAAVAALESEVETLAPNASFTARDLAIRTSIAPSLGASVTVTLRDDRSDTPVTCAVSGTATTCDSGGDSTTLSAGSRLSLKIVSSGVVPAMSVLIGWQAA
jgi:hypothetical protein